MLRRDEAAPVLRAYSAGDRGKRAQVPNVEISGKAAVFSKIQKVCPRLTKDSPETGRIVKKLKDLENEATSLTAPIPALSC